MQKILVIQNARLEGPGTIGRLLESDGFELETIFAKKEEIPVLDHKMVLVLGAPESANDDLAYLKDEMDVIRQAVQNKIPVLGICLGSQLMAKALGARVYPGPKKEIGFYHDVVPYVKSGLFDGMSSPFAVFHWHGDTFDIPDGAQRLAHSGLYNQAFRYGSAVGVQFHLEVDGDIVKSWLDHTKEDIPDYIDPDKIHSQIDSHIPKVQKNMETFYKNFRSEFKLAKV
ncbi:type 1 glutamine amidotransferase [Candidatus Nitrosotenuis cloacae]|uniref:type 1 glutamine amidotransferase n=1 Tax=Candidatus Nitrosotenuis cloacae TaxID=1603555 RepID=UPI00227DFE8C|nr:gamma-glutamyl-gamma-aminobutyrate hydrolase family protein [Candidatus Nitrosotenuis cloacae]